MLQEAADEITGDFSGLLEASFRQDSLDEGQENGMNRKGRNGGVMSCRIVSCE